MSTTAVLQRIFYKVMLQYVLLSGREEVCLSMKYNVCIKNAGKIIINDLLKQNLIELSFLFSE